MNISRARPRFEGVKPLDRTYVFERRGCCLPSPDGRRLDTRRGQKKADSRGLHAAAADAQKNGSREPVDPKGTAVAVTFRGDSQRRLERYLEVQEQARARGVRDRGKPGVWSSPRSCGRSDGRKGSDIAPLNHRGGPDGFVQSITYELLDLRGARCG